MNGKKQMNNLQEHRVTEASPSKTEDHLKEQRFYNLSSQLKEVSWLILVSRAMLYLLC